MIIDGCYYFGFEHLWISGITSAVPEMRKQTARPASCLCGKARGIRFASRRAWNEASVGPLSSMQLLLEWPWTLAWVRRDRTFTSMTVFLTQTHKPLRSIGAEDRKKKSYSRYRMSRVKIFSRHLGFGRPTIGSQIFAEDAIPAIALATLLRTDIVPDPTPFRLPRDPSQTQTRRPFHARLHSMK